MATASYGGDGQDPEQLRRGAILNQMDDPAQLGPTNQATTTTPKSPTAPSPVGPSAQSLAPSPSYQGPSATLNTAPTTGQTLDPGASSDPTRSSAIANWYQQYLGRTPDQSDTGYTGWVNGQYSLPQVQAFISNSPEAQAYAQQPQQGGPAGGTDMRSALSSVFAKYGLDPNNPGINGLANLDYFMQRANATNPNDTAYWTNRLTQEIEHYKNGGPAVQDSSGAGTGAGTAPGGFDPNSPFLSTFRDAVTRRLGQLQQPITQNDPAISGAINAYHTANQRNLQDVNSALAEQAYANSARGGGGVDTGYVTNKSNQAREMAGAQEGLFGGNLVAQADQQRQAMLDQLLGLGNSDVQQGNQLGFNYAQLGQQNNQFYSQLGQQNNQFNSGLGYNYATLQAQMNRDAFLQSLGLL